MADPDERFVLLLEGEYQHRIASVLSATGPMLRVKTVCSAGRELDVSMTAVQSLPHGRRTEMQARALGPGAGGNIQKRLL